MDEVSSAARFALGERVRIITAPGYELLARIREVREPWDSNGRYRYRVSLDAAMEKPMYVELGEDSIHKLPRLD